MEQAFTLKELADRFGGEMHGDADTRVDHVAPLHSADPGAISFFANTRYRTALRSTVASVVILSDGDVSDCPVSALVCSNPYATYAKVAALFVPRQETQAGIHSSAVVERSADIHETACVGPLTVVEAGACVGAGAVIGPGCILGPDCAVGAGSRLVSRVTLCNGVEIGERVLIHPGVVIGADGFGIAMDGDTWVKVPQLGSVRVGNDVEIGANTTIDRGALEDTVIGDDVHLDNQIQIAHNVVIGAHTAIAACAGVAGSSTIGAHCLIAGGVGIIGHLSVADHVQITAMSLVTRSIKEAGVYSSGTPLQPNREWRRNAVQLRHLDELAKRLRKLEGHNED